MFLRLTVFLMGDRNRPSRSAVLFPDNLFGALIEAGARSEILWGYVLGGGLMLAAAAVEIWLGVAAERKPLEEVAPPLSSRSPNISN